MKLLRQFGIILLIVFIGEAIQRLLKIPIPGNVIGMILLFIALNKGIIKLDMIGEISSFLLDHLSFFYIPAGVGLIAYISVLKSDGIAITLISVITTIMVMLVTAFTVQAVRRGGKK
jgi:holin-like protein